MAEEPKRPSNVTFKLGRRTSRRDAPQAAGSPQRPREQMRFQDIARAPAIAASKTTADDSQRVGTSQVGLDSVPFEGLSPIPQLVPIRRPHSEPMGGSPSQLRPTQDASVRFLDDVSVLSGAERRSERLSRYMAEQISFDMSGRNPQSSLPQKRDWIEVTNESSAADADDDIGDDIEETQYPAADNGNTTFQAIEKGFTTARIDKESAREKGDRRRRVIPGTKYTVAPGTYVPHRDFIDQVPSDTPIDQYTQILLWCLNRRLLSTDKQLKGSEVRTTAQECARITVSSLIESLAKGNPRLDWATRGPIEQGPKAPNPRNESNRRTLEQLKKHSERLTEETQQWIALNREWEVHRSDASKAKIKTSQVNPLGELVKLYPDFNSEIETAVTQARDQVALPLTLAQKILVDTEEQLKGVAESMNTVAHAVSLLGLVNDDGEHALMQSRERIRPRVNPHNLLKKMTDTT